QRHCRSWVDICSVHFQRAWPIFDCRNIQHGELQPLTDLLRSQTDSMRCMHRLDHVRSQLTNSIINFLNPLAFGPEDWVAVWQDWQNHFSSRVNAGRFLTPASFNASITLMIVPKEAFLSACSASVDLRASGKSRTAVSNSSTLIARPSSLTSSF